MKVFIHLPQDMRKGHREVEIHHHGQILNLTEQELDTIYKQMQDAPLDMEQKNEDDREYYKEDQPDDSQAGEANDRMAEDNFTINEE